jgi:fructose-1,6-bisphosphatase II
MEKIACGPIARGAIDLNKSATENIRAVAARLKKPVEMVTVVILDRPRHERLIAEVREVGARIRLITDGDVSAGVATCWENSGIDLLMGMGGDFQGRLKFRNDEERARAEKMGIRDLDKTYCLQDLVKGSALFCATGVTDGPLLDGVRTLPNQKLSTHSLVMRSATGTIRFIEATHDLSRKPI